MILKRNSALCVFHSTDLDVTLLRRISMYDIGIIIIIIRGCLETKKKSIGIRESP